MIIGFTPGPLTPPNLLANNGFLVFISIFIPFKVFETTTPSPFPFLTAFAIATISLTIGANLT